MSCHQVINKPTHRCGHIDRVIVRPDNDIHEKSNVTDSLYQTIIALNPTSTFLSLSLLPYTGLLWNMANIDRPPIIAELTSVSEFSSVEKVNQLCDFLRTVVDKHVPPSLRKVINHNSSPWFESIKDELFIAKGERRQAESKWRNTKLPIFEDLH